jgi:hypothetical protein
MGKFFFFLLNTSSGGKLILFEPRHYFYQLKGEYAVPMTPRGWFRSRQAPGEEIAARPGLQSGIAGLKNSSPRRNKKRLILSQSMVIDIDPNKVGLNLASIFPHAGNVAYEKQNSYFSAK